MKVPRKVDIKSNKETNNYPFAIYNIYLGTDLKNRSTWEGTPSLVFYTNTILMTLARIREPVRRERLQAGIIAVLHKSPCREMFHECIYYLDQDLAINLPNSNKSLHHSDIACGGYQSCHIASSRLHLTQSVIREESLKFKIS